MRTGLAFRPRPAAPRLAEPRPRDPVDSSHGDPGGLLVLMRWFDVDAGSLALSVLHDGTPMWGRDAVDGGWPGVASVLDALGAGLAGAAGAEGVGVAFRAVPPPGPQALRFEVVGEDLDLVSPAGRRRTRRHAGLDAVLKACDEIAARLCVAGQDPGAPTRWALARPLLRRPPAPTLMAPAADQSGSWVANQDRERSDQDDLPTDITQIPASLETLSP